MHSPPQKPPPGSDASLPARPGPFRILVIDDNHAIHDDFRKVLNPVAGISGADESVRAELFGDSETRDSTTIFQVDSAFQGREGLVAVQAALQSGQPYAMAFVDVRMPPGWDGLETIAEIWKHYPELEVVLCTAYSDYSWEDLFRKLGSTDQLVILKKPFDNVEAQQLAHALCVKWSLRRQVRARLEGLAQAVEERTATLRQANRQLELEVEERRRVVEALHQSQAMVLRQERLAAIGQLSAGVAHDFNNIMTVIQGYAELILTEQGCAPEWNHALKEMMTAAVRAGKLTQQLLAFSRQQVMRCRSLDVVELVNNLGGLLSRTLGERIALRIHYQPGIPPVYADPTQLEQVLLNLAVNARDAMPDGGELSISVAPVQIGPERVAQFPESLVGRFVCVGVADTGCGMDAATLKRIFEPFFTTKDVGQGTGLGLATVYGIVKQHQGWVEVESAVGRGSTFRIYLPIGESSAETTVEKKSAVEESRGQGETILVVEDDPTVRNLVKNICLRSGYLVLEARTGDEAVEVFNCAPRRVDLVLTDLVMPGSTSGKQLADQLCLQDPDLKVIFTSGYNREAQKGFLREGVNFLRKPYHPPTLLELIHNSIHAGTPLLEACGA